MSASESTACDAALEALVVAGDGRAFDRHAIECAACHAGAAELHEVAAALQAHPLPPPALGARVLAAATPLLSANARRALRRQIARAVLAALIPLPLVLAVDAYLLVTLHGWLRTVLPPPLGLYVVAQQALFVALACAAIYGAVPLLAARQAMLAAGARHG